MNFVSSRRFLIADYVIGGDFFFVTSCCSSIFWITFHLYIRRGNFYAERVREWQSGRMVVETEEKKRVVLWWFIVDYYQRDKN